MVHHRAIAATSAAAFVFALILFSNLVLFTGSQSRAHLQLEADAEDSLAVGAQALLTSGGVDILVRSTQFLSVGSLPCASAVEEAGSFAGGFAFDLGSGNMTAAVTSLVPVDANAEDNLSTVAPFNGSVRGEFDVSFKEVVSGAYPGTEVGFHKVETHSVHLPARLRDAEGICLSAFASAEKALTSAAGLNCNDSAIGKTLSSAIAYAASAAAEAGFILGMNHNITGASPCSVLLTVTVAQPGISSPQGAFTMRLQAVGEQNVG